MKHNIIIACLKPYNFIHYQVDIKIFFNLSGDVIHFSQALPGTRYDFWLYYSNSSTGSNPISNNSPQQTPGNVIVPVGSGTETLINGAVSSSLSPQSHWLLTWTASITTGIKNMIRKIYFISMIEEK